LSSWTAFLAMRKEGGSGARERKSAMPVLLGANNLVCRQSSCNQGK